jgi:hypothetical protein
MGMYEKTHCLDLVANVCVVSSGRVVMHGIFNHALSYLGVDPSCFGFEIAFVTHCTNLYVAERRYFIGVATMEVMRSSSY